MKEPSPNNWRTVFPDVAAACVPELPADFEDVTGPDDHCPNFIAARRGWMLWVDPQEPAMRMLSEYKFCLEQRPVDAEGTDTEGSWEVILFTNDWQTVLNVINTVPEEA